MDAATTLRRARHSAGISQAELARRARVPQATVARIEAGSVVPSLATFDRLLTLCGTPLRPVPRESTSPPPFRGAGPGDRPYWLWDTDLTLAEFTARLHTGSASERGWALSRLLAHATWPDIWNLVTAEQLRKDWPLVRLADKDVWTDYLDADAACAA
jgi:transcriptional regulator with XRE-family HTH domain